MREDIFEADTFSCQNDNGNLIITLTTTGISQKDDLLEHRIGMEFDPNNPNHVSAVDTIKIFVDAFMQRAFDIHGGGDNVVKLR